MWSKSELRPEIPSCFLCSLGEKETHFVTICMHADSLETSAITINKSLKKPIMEDLIRYKAC